MGLPRPQSAFPSIPGMDILGEIGRGGSNILYRVRYRGGEYALKVPLHAPRDPVRALAAFRREAYVLALLRHPAIPSVFEVGHTDGLPWIVMSHVEARPLSALIFEGPQPEAEVRRAAVSLASALQALHARGLIHRDLKPRNILVGPDSRYHLIDLGLAAEFRDPGEGNEAAGTFLYSAPEQTGALSRPVDGRADLYSLGVVLFEMLAGRPPFEDADVASLIRKHATAAPPPIQQLNPDVSAQLASVIGRLLSKDPEERYPRAEALLEELDSTRSQPRVDSRRIFGRADDLARLEEAWRRATQGRGAVAVLEGEPGSGKSFLADAFLRGLSDPDQVVSGICSRDGATPFGVFREAFNRHLERLAPESHESFLGEIDELLPLLHGFSPVLDRLIERRLGPARNENLQDQFIDALAELFVRVARRRGGAVLLLDDIQWIDDSSERVLRALATKARRAPLLILATARAGELKAPLEGALSIRLGPLSEEAASELIASELGGHPVDEGFAAQILSRSKGVPFALRQYIRSLLDAGVLVYSWGRWELDSEALMRLELPGSVLDLLLKRLGQLTPESRRLLTVAAVAGKRFSHGLLSAVAEGAGIGRALEEALALDLIERDGREHYRFTHDRITEALVAPLSEVEARTLHQRIAAELEGLAGAGPSELETYAIAHHYSLGETERAPERVFRSCLAAGRHALGVYADERAKSFLDTARRFADHATAEERFVLERALGRACERLGLLKDSIAHYEGALALCSDAVEQARIHTRIAAVLQVEFDFPRAWSHFHLGLRCLGRPLPRNPVWQFVSMVGFYAVDFVVTHLGWSYGRASGRRREILVALAELYDQGGAIAFFDMANFMLLQLQPRHSLVTHALGPSRQRVNSLINFGIVLSVLQLEKPAMARINACVAMAERLGDRVLAARTRFFLGAALDFLGHTVRSEAIHADNAVTNRSWLELYDYMNSCVYLAWRALIRGYGREAVRWSERAFQRYENAAVAKNLRLGHPMFAYQAAGLGMLGLPAEGLKILREAGVADLYQNEASRAEFARKTVYQRADILALLTLFYLEQGELGEPLEFAISSFRGMGFLPELLDYNLKHFYVFQAHARLLQLAAAPESERSRRRADLRRALSELKRAANTSLYRSHHQAILAAELASRGKERAAVKALQAAEAEAHRADNPWALMLVLETRARLTGDEGHPSRVRQLRMAEALALQHGWVARAKALRDRNGLAPLAGVDSHPSSHLTAATSRFGGSMPGSGDTATGSRLDPRAQLEGFRQQRHLKALLQVSLAASATLDVEEQARGVLGELVRILGAERGYLFVREGEDQALAFRAGCDADGAALPEGKLSTTVVERVRSTQQPLIVSGTEEGALLGSESAVVLGLRSIAAAPLLVRDRLVGVVYLDNRLAKGVFTPEDLDILVALSNHIAIALETARTARLEAERRALEKDLELTGLVQHLVIPQAREARAPRLELALHYQPASVSGGDWWWHEVRPDGSLLLLMGDVTGHGAGAAMVTAVVSGCFHSLNKRLAPSPDVSQIVRELSEDLEALCKQKYWMTLAVIHVNAEGSALTVWNGGTPPILVAGSDGAIRRIQLADTPPGMGRPREAPRTVPLQVGDRIFTCTDGVTEFKDASGRVILDNRRLRDVVRDLPRDSAALARDRLSARLAEAASDRQQPADDDVTFAVVDVLPLSGK